MDEGWHTYWRNPGDSGLATTIEWNLPEGLKAGEIEWPYPAKVNIPPFVVFGYDREVFLLTKMDAASSLTEGAEKTIQAKIVWLSCKEICVPGEADLSLTLPVLNQEPKLDEKWAEPFADTRAKLPVHAKEWNMTAVKVRNKIIFYVENQANADFNPQAIEFFPYEPGLIDYSKPMKIKPAKNGFELNLPLTPIQNKIPSKLQGVLVCEKGRRGEQSGQAILVDIPIEKKSGFFNFS